LLLFVGADANAQDMLDRVGPLDEVYESYNDCFAATKGGKLNPDALIKLGWSRAETDGAGADVPVLFARSDRAPVVMLSGSLDEGICIVSARFENVAAMQKFLGAWGAALPKFEKGEVSFSAEGHPVMFRQAGSQTKPRLNLVVGMGPEAKE
jgi:hypothetical protein